MKIIIAVKTISASSDVRQGSKYSSDFEYASVLNIPESLICRGSEYDSGSEYVRVLDI